MSITALLASPLTSHGADTVVFTARKFITMEQALPEATAVAVEDGKSEEKIYDIAVPDGREIAADGRCKTPVGDTENVETRLFTNTIGDAMLAAYWEDPDFDPAQTAFHYVRALEIPTPSWLAYDRVAFGEIDVPDSAVMKQQERAYTTPIWYTP